MKKRALLLLSPFVVVASLALAAQQQEQEQPRQPTDPQAQVEEQDRQVTPEATPEGEHGKSEKARGKKQCDYDKKRGGAEETSTTAT